MNTDRIKEIMIEASQDESLLTSDEVMSVAAEKIQKVVDEENVHSYETCPAYCSHCHKDLVFVRSWKELNDEGIFETRNEVIQ